MSKAKARQPIASTIVSKKKASGTLKKLPVTNRSAIKNAIGDNATSTEKLVSTPVTKRLPPSSLVLSKSQSRNAAKYKRRPVSHQTRYLALRHAYRKRMLTWIGVVLLTLVIASLGYWIYQAHMSSAQAANSPSIYQETVYDSRYLPVNNIYCDQQEGQVTHIHAHVSIYINGEPVLIPQFIGIAQDGSGNPICYYWLHTHDMSGVIHIESPANAKETFTFGQFVAMWNQKFNSMSFPDQLLLTSGWTIWINGHTYRGTITSIPLAKHSLITIAYNSPNVKPDTTYAWNGQ